MLSFGALNALSTAEDSSASIFHEVRQEEQEAEALEMYNEALRLYCNEELTSAEQLFLDVLQTDLIVQAPESIADKENLVDSPALFLKYNVLKNLARIYEKLQNNEKALDFYLNASVVDETDVNLWITIASIARKALNIRLERFAYEKGLICSPNNWSCLDNLISALYILGDYAACLCSINRAFERNENYVKGHAFRDQIFKEEPHFKNDCLELEYLFTEDQFNSSDKYQEYIEEALVIRGKRVLSAKRDEIQEEKLTKPFIYYTWINFGECLLCLYNDLITRTECKSLAARVDLMKYYKTKEQQNGLLIPSEMFTKKGYKTGTKEHESKKRRKMSAQEVTEPQPKRRSARVKISKSKEIDVNWSDLISSFLPNSLKSDTSTDTDCSQDSLTDLFPGKLVSQASNIDSFKKELVAVSNFVNSKVTNNGCIDLFGGYLLAIVNFYEHQQQWQQELSSIFISIYKKYRKHVSWSNLFSSPLCNETENADMGKMILVALELELEQLIVMMETEKRESPASSPLKILNSRKLMLAKEFLIDFHNLSLLGANNYILAEQDCKFRTRFYWLHAQYCIMQNEIVPAVNALNNCAHTLSISSLEEIFISNCCRDNVINQRTILKKLEFVQQSQTLDEIQVTFNAGKYAEVVDLLKLALNEKMGKTSLTTERPLQLVLLLESYFKTGQIKNCIECCLIALNEAVASGISDLWRVHLNHLLILVYDCFTDKLFHYDCLLVKDKQVFADNFIKIIEISMTIELMECVSTLPWILLHKLLKFDSCLNKENVGTHSLIDFLRTAHEYLGRKHWCCHDKGLFLQYFIKELQEMNQYDLKLHEKEMLFKDMEQCLYCLYGDPCRKSKSKVLVDHNDAPITLNWSNAKVLYEFYKPTDLPCFDLRVNTISPEVQNVFRKIAAIVPKKDIEVIPFEELMLYIEGGENFPEIVAKQNETPDLFYYLGDFYFKNKEFSKALKFYMHDVSINPNRFQSWAAMALARGSRLEEKINQCDLKTDSVMKKHITTTLRCFEKAVSINNNKCVILEEYGQTAYMLNSFASRRLKEVTQEGKQDLPTNEFYLKMKTDMLHLSFKCFNEALQKANSCENEQWLYYYMLGKASEKLKHPPDQYLEFYQKSLHELYKNGGRFQKKISYHGAPEYSIEVIELFFRIHASILKLLMYAVNIEYDILEKHLSLACCQAVYQDMNEDIPKYTVITPGADSYDPLIPVASTHDTDNKNDADNNNHDKKTQSILQLENKYFQSSSLKTCFFEKSVNEVNFEIYLLIQDILLKIESKLISESLLQSPLQSSLESKVLSTCSEKLSKIDFVVKNPKSPSLSINSEVYSFSQNDLSVVKLLLNDLVEKISEDEKYKTSDIDILPNHVSSNEKSYLTKINSKIFGSEEKKHLSTNESENEKYLLENENKKCLNVEIFFGNLLSTCKKNLVQHNFKNKEEKHQYKTIAQKCLDALAFCLQRFPEHYKSRYMMSYFFMVDKEFKNLKYSRNFLLGDCNESSLHFNLSANGIISSKKKTNLFQMLSLSIKNCWGVASLRQSVGFPACKEYEYFAPLGSCIVCWNIMSQQKVLQFQAHSDLIVVMSKSKSDLVLTASYSGEIKLWTKKFDYIYGFNFPSNNVIFGTWSENNLLFAIISNSPKSMIVVYSIKFETEESPLIEQVMQYMAPLATDNDAKVLKCCFSFCVFYYGYIIVIYQTEKTSDIYKICLQTNDSLKVKVKPLGDECNGIYCLSEIKKNTFALGLNQGIFAFYNADTLDLISIIQASGSPQVCTWYGEYLLTVSYLSGRITIWSTDGMLIQDYKGGPNGSVVSVQQSLHGGSSIWVGGIMSLHYVTLSESFIEQCLDLSFHMVTGCGIDISSEKIVASGDFTGQVLLWRNNCELPIKKRCFTNSVRCLMWCEDILLVGLLDGQMYQWKFSGEDYEPKEVYNFIGGVVSIKANSNRRKLAVGTTHGYLYIFSVQIINGFLNFDILYSKVQHKHANNLDMEIWSLAWSPDNNKIATASEDQTCSINDSENGEILYSLTGHTSAVTSVGWKILSSSKNILVTCADDQTARIYDGISYELLKVLDTYELYGWHTLTYIVIDDTKDFLFISTQNGYIVVWNLCDYKCSAKYKLHSGSIEGLIIDKEQILTIGSDCVVNNFSIKEESLTIVKH